MGNWVSFQPILSWTVAQERRCATMKRVIEQAGSRALPQCCLFPLQLFFSFMALALLGVKYKSDKRDQYLHHGNWMVKLGLWLFFCALPFLFPNGLVNMFGACCLVVAMQQHCNKSTAIRVGACRRSCIIEGGTLLHCRLHCALWGWRLSGRADGHPAGLFPDME